MYQQKKKKKKTSCQEWRNIFSNICEMAFPLPHGQPFCPVGLLPACAGCMRKHSWAVACLGHCSGCCSPFQLQYLLCASVRDSFLISSPPKTKLAKDPFLHKSTHPPQGWLSSASQVLLFCLISECQSKSFSEPTDIQLKLGLCRSCQCTGCNLCLINGPVSTTPSQHHTNGCTQRLAGSASSHSTHQYELGKLKMTLS